MSIIQSDTDPKNVEAVIENIQALNGDEKELLWDWFNGKTIVGGMLVDLPNEENEKELDDDKCAKCGTTEKDNYESLCYDCQMKKHDFNTNKCKDCSREIEFGVKCDRCAIGDNYA